MTRPIYCETPPPPALADYVECFWTSSGMKLTADARKHRVLPDGCVDILFTAELHPRGGLSSNCALSLVGTMTRYRDFILPANPFYVGIRFKPAAVTSMLSFPVYEITDETIPLAEVWGSEGERLLEKLYRAGSAMDCAQILRGVILRRLPPRKSGEASAVSHAVEKIVTAGGNVAIDRLSASVNTSPRNLRRLVKAHAGIGPKRLCRVLRFRKLRRVLHDVVSPDWAALALECGYYDQAHLVNEFRELSGYTPQEFHLRRSPERHSEAAEATGIPALVR